MLREGMQAVAATSSPRMPAPSTMVEIAGYTSPPTSYGGGGGGYGSSAPMASSTGWQVHYNEAGRAFYYDPRTGRTQWDPPSGFA